MTNQPTPSAKEQVLAWVRSKNPQTMELKMGCIFQFKTGFVTPSDGKILPDRYCNHSFFLLSHNIRGNSPIQTSDFRTTKLTFCDTDSFSSAIALTIGSEIPMSYFTVNLNILGSDMTKQEFEIALMSIHGKNKVHVGWHSNCPFGAKDFFEGMFIYHIQHENGSVNLAFDLTKNLHNQEPEFYEALLPIIS